MIHLAPVVSGMGILKHVTGRGHLDLKLTRETAGSSSAIALQCKIKQQYPLLGRIVFSTFLLLAIANGAVAEEPSCLAAGQVLAVNNATILKWKSSTVDQYHNRGHVKGPLLQIYPDRSGHRHLEVKIGPKAGQTIEVVYNEDFGRILEPEIGADIEACGDYITARSSSGGYPPSPDGAILHWVHRSNRPDKHDSGYLMINEVLYGTETATAGPKRY